MHPERKKDGRRRASMATADSVRRHGRSQPAYQKVLENPEAVSDRGRGVRSRGERPTRGARKPKEMILSLIHI